MHHRKTLFPPHPNSPGQLANVHTWSCSCYCLFNLFQNLYTATVVAVNTFSVRQMWLSLYQNIPQNHLLLDKVLHREGVVAGMWSQLPPSFLPPPLAVYCHIGSQCRGRESLSQEGWLTFLSTAVLAEGKV